MRGKEFPPPPPYAHVRMHKREEEREDQKNFVARERERERMRREEKKGGKERRRGKEGKQAFLLPLTHARVGRKRRRSYPLRVHTCGGEEEEAGGESDREGEKFGEREK